MKGLIHKFYCELYMTHLTVCFCKETYERKNNHGRGRDYGGCVIDDNGTMNIFLEKNKGGISVSNCAHEAFHAADFIADKVGLVVSECTGNEHMAYLIGWIVEKVFDCLELDDNLERKMKGE